MTAYDVYKYAYRQISCLWSKKLDKTPEDGKLYGFRDNVPEELSSVTPEDVAKKQDKSPNDDVLYGLLNGGLQALGDASLKDVGTDSGDVPVLGSGGLLDKTVLPQATSTDIGAVTLGVSGGAARYGEKADVGLGNVDNTSDINKPISTAQQLALDTKVEAVIAGADIIVDSTDSKRPIVTAGENLVRDVVEDPNVEGFVPTNKADGRFVCTGLSSDGTLYFGSNNTGIWKLDSTTGNIVQTNKTDGTFYCTGLSSDGTLYFGSNLRGVWKLDTTTGNIIQVNAISDIFNCTRLSPDGTLYFCLYSNGIMKLDNLTGNIISTNRAFGDFLCTGLSVDGVLYFGGRATGIWKLDSLSGNIVPTNNTNGYFRCTGLSSDGTLYFGSDNTGIWKLDNATGNIIQTNKTDEGFYCTGLSSDGILYFGNGNTGVWKLDNITGNIVPTNKTDGFFRSTALSSDGTLYFGSNNGIWKLDTLSGNIVQTNKIDGVFQGSGLSSDGTLYFESSTDGIWKLNSPDTDTYGRVHGSWVSLDDTFLKIQDLPTPKTITGESAITVTDTATNATIRLKINAADKFLSQDADGVRSEATLKKLTTTDPNLSAQYALVGKDGTTIMGATIDVTKDKFIKEVTYNSTTHILSIVFILQDGSEATTNIDLSDLVDIYTASFGIKKVGADFQGVVDPSSELFLTVGADGFRVSGIQSAIDTAIATNVVPATSTPLMASGAGAVGSSTKYSREDHIHPEQINITGNAGSATKLATARTVSMSGTAQAPAVTFDGTVNINLVTEIPVINGGTW